MTAVLTLPQARQLLGSVVAQAGADHVYQRVGATYGQPGFCLYSGVADGEVRRCVVGEILHAAGVTDDQLRRLVGAISLLVDQGELDGIVVIDGRAVGPLAAVQRAQDEGARWGDLPAVFDREAGLVST